jgi:single-strand DNA-binding protein
MADDRMKNDDLQRNMGGAGDKDQKNYGGQQSPGRSGQSHGGGQQAGQHGGGQQSGGQFGGQKGTRNMDADDEDFDTGKSGSQNRGGQNR